MRKMIIPTIFTLLAAVVSLVFYNELPTQMAVHFNFAQNPDNWMPRWAGSFMLPAIILLISGIIIIAAKFDKEPRNEANLGFVISIISVLMFAVHCFTIAFNLGYKMNLVLFTTTILGIVFILVGNLMPRLRQGSMKYPKLPEHIQGKAARFQGRFMFVVGLILLLLMLLPTNYMFPTFITTIAIFSVTMITSSVYFSRQR